jgi:hypothetical protein
MRQIARGERNGNAKLTSAEAVDVYLLARSKRYFQWQIGEACEPIASQSDYASPRVALALTRQ